MVFICFVYLLFQLLGNFNTCMAYRQLTWWGWQQFGRHRRVVLPSCAVAKIRHVQEFPSASEEYTGHQYLPATS